MGLAKDIGKALKKSAKRNYWAVFGPHWEYVCDVFLDFNGRGATLNVSREDFRREEVPRALKHVRLQPGSGDVNWGVVKGRHFRYKIEYRIPSDAWQGDPQNFGHLLGDGVDAKVYRKRRISSIKREHKSKSWEAK